ncbi:hypothetical protein B0T18DRAFT_492317 [Schizothecium vesticola]|uniref:Uncharacterized protein n=1 Tax=Schizothecium vesticola TaxID=314040 RepID=A0AA40BQ61_9PEZI|nr:hypothetical protein B0T18DRAFT_492317 [Schizothecium vesticola]
MLSCSCSCSAATSCRRRRRSCSELPGCAASTRPRQQRLTSRIRRDKCTSASSCARASPRLMNGHPMHRRPTRSCTCDPPVSWAAMIGCWPLWGMRRASSRDPPARAPKREKKKYKRGWGEVSAPWPPRWSALLRRRIGRRPGRPRFCSLGRRRRLSCGVAQ